VFTLKQIDEIHDTFGKADTLSKYLQALNALGIDTYDSYLTDGHSEYFGGSGEQLSSPPVHEIFMVAEKSNRERFLEHLELHKQHKTSYLEMSKGLASSGIEKWTFDTEKMTITYYDRVGNTLLREVIK